MDVQIGSEKLFWVISSKIEIKMKIFVMSEIVLIDIYIVKYFSMPLKV